VRKLHLTLWFSTSLLAIGFCPRVLAQTGAAKPGTATVSGRVTVKGEPARGLAVALQLTQQNLSSNQSTVPRAKTDGDGRFRFTGVAAGNYLVVALAPGFTSSINNNYTQRGKTLNVSAGDAVEGVEIDLRPGGVITGRVTDAQGRPLTDQSVALTYVNKDGSKQRYYDFASYEMSTIDDRGVYRVYGLREGRYLVSVGFAPVAGAATYQSTRTFYPRTFSPDTADESKAKIFEVVEGEETTGADITVGGVKKAYDVFGKVLNADTGRPAPGVELTYVAVGNDGSSLDSYIRKGELSDANGGFKLTSLLPGKYKIFALQTNASDFYSDPTICDVDDGDAHDVEVKVRQGASISGFVIIEGANDSESLSKLGQIQVYADTKSEQSLPGPAAVKVFPNGGFQIRGLRPGKVDVFIVRTPGLNLSKLRLENNGKTQPDGIEVKPGEHIPNARLVVGYSVGVIRGLLKTVGGVIPEGYVLTVWAKRADNPTVFGGGSQVDALGQFRIEGLIPGKYKLNVTVNRSPAADPRFPQIYSLITRVEEDVVVSGAAEAQATLVIDFR
jgi:5-hydroxyisourate hydrolase-like protein (transthyretin family)